MVLKITDQEAIEAIRYYYNKVKGFDIGPIKITREGIKKIGFELEVKENIPEKKKK